MSKIRDFMRKAPYAMGLDDRDAAEVSRALMLIYDYEAEEKGKEFSRLGDKMEDCEKRLDIVFGIVERKCPDEVAYDEFKKLLLLASTPDEVEQERIAFEFTTDEEPVYADLLTVDEASEIGARGLWSG